MTCSPDRSQSVLRFKKAVEDSDIDILCVAGERHMLYVVLQAWSDANGFGECAFQVKRLYRDWALNNTARAANLIRGFGFAFKGDQVGALGHDIIGGALKSVTIEIRDAALMALESWCEDDEQWLSFIETHRDQEETTLLTDYCTQILTSYEWTTNEEDSCTGGGDCDDLSRFSAGPDFSQDFMEPPPVCPPEVEAFLDVTRPLVTNMVEAKSLPASKLPDVLKGLVGLHQDTVLDLIESYRIGRKTPRPSNLNVWVGNWTGHPSLYCWTKDWGLWMSADSPYSTGGDLDDRWHIKAFLGAS
jgi:hypothetical protein